MAITVAWLEAVRRVQSQAIRRHAEVDHAARPRREERTLTDAIEAALVSAGAAADAVSAPKPVAETRALDLSV